MLTAVGLRDLQLRPISLAVLSLLGNAIDEAVAILQKYDGSLWVASPDYTFTGSDGTGAAGDGSDAGYARDLCATYGAELLTNGDFSQGATGWTLQQPTAGSVSIAGGVASIISTDGSNSYLQAAGTPLTVGKIYELSCDYATTVGSVSLRDSSGTIIKALSVGKNTLQFVATTATFRFNRDGACNCTIDNVSVREVVGRPLTQPTTGFKPKLKRVPKRLGPELATNGDFANGSTGWSLTAAATVSGGSLSLNGSGSDALATQSSQCFSGTSYQVSYQVTSFTSGNVSVNFGGQASMPVNAVGNYSQVLAPATSNSTGVVVQARFGIGFVGTVDNISVREVLEWGWAWVFDGTNDILATVTLPAGTDETIMVCATSLTSAGTARAPIGKRNTNNGLFIRRESGGALNGNAMTGSGFGSMALESPHTNFRPFIATVSAKSGASRGRFNGSQVATTSGVYAGWAGPLGVGAEKGTDSGTQWNGNVFAAAYAPAAIPDAELLIIEKAMAELGGITL